MNVRKQQIGLKNTICSYLTEDDWLIFATHNTFKWRLFATYITLQIEWVKSGVTFQTRRVSPRLSKLMSLIDHHCFFLSQTTKKFLQKKNKHSWCSTHVLHDRNLFWPSQWNELNNRLYKNTSATWAGHKDEQTLIQLYK